MYAEEAVLAEVVQLLKNAGANECRFACFSFSRRNRASFDAACDRSFRELG
jgi:hypothetical protein